MAALYGKKAHLKFAPFDEFATQVSEQDAADTLGHISHSPSCSCVRCEQELEYHTRITMETVAEHL